MTLLVDFETKSQCDLKAHGGRLYAAHPSTEVLCAVVHDTESGTTGVWYPGDPPVVTDDIVVAHNADDFDRHIAARAGWQTSRPWGDSAIAARRAGLPGALDALGTRWLARPKDKAASKFTISLSKHADIADAPPPISAAVTAIEDKKARGRARAAELKAWRARPAAERRGAVMRIVTDYCASDVGIMEHGWPRLRPYLEDGIFAGWEGDVLTVDRIVNDRGIAFDSALARRLLECDARNREIAIEAAAAVCGWSAADTRTVVSSPQQFAHITGRADATAETVDGIIAGAGFEDPRIVALAEARRALATIARGKLEAGLARVSPDGRLRDMHRYYGAHTGRWSGRGMQLQNIPRPEDRFGKFGDVEICAMAAATLDGAWLDPGEIMVLLRACLTASPRRALVVRDFSSVEARFLAWCAGDTKALEVFASGRNPYFVAAAMIFGLRYEDIKKGTDQYDIGKKAELGCFAADTLVLTDHGPRPIAEVCSSDRLWDGVAWVEHQGLIHQGIQQVVDCSGVRATSDHPVWCGAMTWSPFGVLAHNDAARFRALGAALDSLLLPAFVVGIVGEWLASSCAVIVGRQSTRWTCSTSGVDALRGVTCAQSAPPGSILNSGTGTQPLSPTTSIGAACATGSQQSCSGAAIQRTPHGAHTVGAGFARTPRGGRIAPHSSRTSPLSLDGITPLSISTGEITIAGTSPEILGSFRAQSINPIGAACKCSQIASPRSRPVYDIAHAGPQNRFTILTNEGPLIVHNCGYGMGAKKFELNYAPSRVGVDAADVVKGWRTLHAPIVRYWRALEDAFVSAVRGRQVRVWPFDFVPTGKDVTVFLPSGRPIVYNDVGLSREIGMNGRERFSPYYLGTKSGREHLYGGKIAENVVQAGCRDLMAEALVKAEERGLCPVLHVHDEIVCDTAPDGEAELAECMITLPEWAEGFPVGAAGHVGERYRK